MNRREEATFEEMVGRYARRPRVVDGPAVRRRYLTRPPEPPVPASEPVEPKEPPK